MSGRFEILADYELKEQGNTRVMFYDLMRNLYPTENVVDDKTIRVTNKKLENKHAVPRWSKFTLDYTDFDEADTSDQVALPNFTLPAGGIVHAAKIKHSEAFTGTGLLTCTVSVGLAADSDKYASAFDVMQAVGDAVFQMDNNFSGETHAAAGTSIIVEAVSSGIDLDQLTGGSVDVWILWSVTED